MNGASSTLAWRDERRPGHQRLLPGAGKSLVCSVPQYREGQPGQAVVQRDSAKRSTAAERSRELRP